MTRFGQCCLLARRLVEAGVRFVTINTFITVFDEITWDIHGSKPFTSIAGMKDIVAPMYDQGYSALLEDLFQRGMLDKTMVACLSEFGRTPKVNSAGGRDHWPNCWTINFAGGGVKGGRVVGKSDDIGAYPTERPVKPAEVVATIYKSLGLDLETDLPGPQSGPFPLVDFGTQADQRTFLAVQSRQSKAVAGIAAAIFCSARLILPGARRSAAPGKSFPKKFILHGQRFPATGLGRDFFATAHYHGQITNGIVLESSDPEDSKTRRRRGIARRRWHGHESSRQSRHANGHRRKSRWKRWSKPFEWSFRNHVQPVLFKAGCSAGACHGAALRDRTVSSFPCAVTITRAIFSR